MRAARPFHLMAKPTGAVCNLACDYCYFLRKEELYPGSSFRMSDAVLERFVEGTLAAQPGAEVTFAWQGGEPTLMGLAFFERAVALAESRRRPHQRVQHTLQTNGTRLDDAWGTFLARHGFLVGISLDGPRELHDRYRHDKGGGGSFDAVMRGVEVLRRHEVEWNALTTVHAGNVHAPLDVYRFLRDEAGARFLQFIPIVERADPSGEQRGTALTERSVSGPAFGSFLLAVFDAWVRRDVGEVFVQAFDDLLGKHLGVPAGICVHQPVCGDALALEHTGDVYACDHYVEAAYRLGNLLDTPLGALVDDPRQRAFGEAKRAGLTAQCRRCPVLALCHGGCPKDRVGISADGEPGQNHLCEGYLAFFTKTLPAMRWMAAAWRAGRAPAEVMAVRQGTAPGQRSGDV
jgi:uncharacterized protein